VRDGAAYYPPARAGEEPRLAGSALSQLEMVQRIVQRGVASIEDALTMASETPARAMGLEKELGNLRVGARADLVLLDARDLRLLEVRIGGVAV
jgi:N-acetylglucosamine-6-phosphate deacetylase